MRIFVLSRVLTPKALLQTVRAYWGIENLLHWQARPDAARGHPEDPSRDNGPVNIVMLRRRALDVARRDTSKGSFAVKLKRAGLDHDFLLRMLREMR